MTEETVMVGLILLVSGYMLYEAQSFGGASQRFPQLAAGATVLGTVLILARNFIPPSLEERLFPEKDDSGGMLDVDDVDSETSAPVESKTGKFGIHGGLFTGVIMVLYASLGLLFGFLLVTPLFIALYMYWFDHPWYSVVGMAILGLIITSVFVDIFRIPVHEGHLLILIGGL
ncbi:tripartite tricarboxylate transporter TctB family protein [Natronorubrum sediminis]|uniref:tripartite tricarboxylate transporter TctB family protein n=1 Tax=Natronorubrum sediminis TaxID=640943 RepID=UPI001587B71A|nr:tripartite tricarboxylate transporter TctB family protein [Natronorubrum sediminis]